MLKKAVAVSLIMHFHYVIVLIKFIQRMATVLMIMRLSHRKLRESLARQIQKMSICWAPMSTSLAT